jgi:glycosyltransferase involved in cell wall biosynthesis
MQLYIDCTETYKTRLNTGIQRVVKKIAHLGNCTPVFFDGIGFIPISNSDLDKRQSSVVRNSRNLTVSLPLIYAFAKMIFRGSLYLKTYFLYPKRRKYYVSFNPGDILLSADIVRGKPLLNYLKKLKIPVYQIVYDILPLTYPQFFSSTLIKDFQEISSAWPVYSKKLFTISKKVSKEVSTHLNTQRVDFFYLGSDFLTHSVKPSTDPTIFNDYFLAVGTIEPRKNHLHILKTFLQLWDQGFTEKLIFVGRKGWDFKDTLAIMQEASQRHPDKFVWLTDATDMELENYYLNAKAVICASFDEGFGLPVVEALSRKKNVICSDIEVFREIGSDFCTFFDDTQNGPKSLSHIIQNHEYKKDISSFRWLTWQESVDILIEKIIKDNQ